MISNVQESKIERRLHGGRLKEFYVYKRDKRQYIVSVKRI